MTTRINFGIDAERGFDGEDLFHVQGYLEVDESDECLEYEVVVESVERYGVALGQMLPVDDWRASDWESDVRDRWEYEDVAEELANREEAARDRAADEKMDAARGL